MKQPRPEVWRTVGTSTSYAGLVGALEVLEHHARRLCHNHPDDYLLDGLRNILCSIDELEAAGRFGTVVTDKREQAMSQHPSGKNRDLTSPLDSPNTHPTQPVTQPSEATERQGADG
jgi:hypothetical protein